MTRRKTKSLSEHAGIGIGKPKQSKSSMSRDVKSSKKIKQISVKRKPTECGSAVEHSKLWIRRRHSMSSLPWLLLIRFAIRNHSP